MVNNALCFSVDIEALKLVGIDVESSFTGLSRFNITCDMDRLAANVNRKQNRISTIMWLAAAQSSR